VLVSEVDIPLYDPLTLYQQVGRPCLDKRAFLQPVRNLHSAQRMQFEACDAGAVAWRRGSATQLCSLPVALRS